MSGPLHQGWNEAIRARALRGLRGAGSGPLCVISIVRGPYLQAAEEQQPRRSHSRQIVVSVRRAGTTAQHRQGRGMRQQTRHSARLGHRHTHIHIHTHVCRHWHTHTQTHTHTHTLTHLGNHAQTHVDIHTCTYASTHTHTCRHKHACIHTQHTHTHTPTLINKLKFMDAHPRPHPLRQA